MLLLDKKMQTLLRVHDYLFGYCNCLLLSLSYILYIYTCMHTYIYTYIHTYIHTYNIHTYIHTDFSNSGSSKDVMVYYKSLKSPVSRPALAEITGAETAGFIITHLTDNPLNPLMGAELIDGKHPLCVSMCFVCIYVVCVYE